MYRSLTDYEGVLYYQGVCICVHCGNMSRVTVAKIALE